MLLCPTLPASASFAYRYWGFSLLGSQEAGTECREKSGPCCWHQGARSSEKYDRKHLPSRPLTPMLNAPLGWRTGIMGSWMKGFNPKFFWGVGVGEQGGVHPKAQGWPGKEVRELACPFQELISVASCPCTLLPLS